MDKHQFNYAKELKAIAKGSKKSLQSLYEQESSCMLAFAFKVLQHYKFAEDAVVDTFKIIWDNAKYFDESLEYPRGWIYTIFRYHLNSIIRKNYLALKENKKENESVLGDVCSNLYAGMHNFVEPGSFYQVFEELPEETQRAIITTYFSPESLADTATLLKMPLGLLKDNIHMGLRHLAQKRQILDIKHDNTLFVGEFVLGSLTESEIQKANNLLAEDPVAEKLSLIWEEEFLHFLKQLILEKTPESLWVRIKQNTIAEKDSSTDNQELEDELQLSQEQIGANGFFDKLKIALKRCWISRSFWRSASLVLMGIIVLLIIFKPFENPIRYVATLHSTTQVNQLGFVVKQNDKLKITPMVQQNLGSQLRLQLWHRDAQGLTRALATVHSDRSTILPRLSLKSGDLLLISIEPANSTSETLTGQILYQGLVADL